MHFDHTPMIEGRVSIVISMLAIDSFSPGCQIDTEHFRNLQPSYGTSIWYVPKGFL